jgi:hypothetical protein
MLLVLERAAVLRTCVDLAAGTLRDLPVRSRDPV